MGKLKYPLGILITMIIGALLNMYLCCDCWGDTGDKSSNEAVVNTVSDDATDQSIALRDPDLVLNDYNGNNVVLGNENFNFLNSGYHYVKPLGTSVAASAGAIKDYLNDNADSKLNITGLYMDDEVNNSAFTNLGEARANDVKNYLVSMGYASNRLGISGELVNNLTVKDSLLLGPVNYSLSKMPTGDAAAAREKELDNLASDIRANPLILKFATGASTINLNATQRDKVSKMVRYLDARPQSSLVSVGHTDNTGSRAINVKISADRAAFAKSYLAENGIMASRIEASGKGPDEPIASNDTEEGKATNRRVVVTLK